MEHRAKRFTTRGIRSGNCSITFRTGEPLSRIVQGDPDSPAAKLILDTLNDWAQRKETFLTEIENLQNAEQFQRTLAYMERLNESLDNLMKEVKKLTSSPS